MARRELPFFAFGNVAVGVIAVGNVARGVVAIGFTVSYGVISIGMNAVGVVAIGLNAVGPISIAAINGVGPFVWAGVNAIGGYGSAFVNAGTWPLLGVALAVTAIVVAQLLYRTSHLRPPREEHVPLARLFEAGAPSHRVHATPRRRGDTMELVDGETRIAIGGDVPDELVGRRCACVVRVVEQLEGGDYRHAPDASRHYRLESITAEDRGPWLATDEELGWLTARSLQVTAAATAIALVAMALG